MAYIDNFDLNSKVTIKRRAYVTDSYAMGSYTCTTITSNQACAIWLLSANEILAHDRIHNPATYSMAIKPSTKYAADDIAISDGTTYRMVQPDNVMNEDNIMIIGLSKDG